ncbi:methyltransferase domain-containing protein [Nonomuraea sp. K274]|uniref:Methyltransferase domain-containing protein n=1 Tax=Nonomuraea cypriaca TaxID=1187855 RepID=A0A931AD71_9ACTN|nr:class I SAM-dependent methyltransferase [Nonomuraea cypriaca]MBF8188024.1 methyltransferase domain-containing protein [Nonomuraea cypriaca]
MSERWFRFLYRIHLTPWETREPVPELVEAVAGTAGFPALPAGRALDIGCGTGTHVIWLARHGWDAAGVDLTSVAVDRAREKARRAGVEARWYVGDFTEPERLGLGDGYGLLFDRGCLHSIPHGGRDAYVRAVTRIAAPGAVLLIHGCYPSRGPWPKPAGIAKGEIAARFADGWEVETEEDRERGHAGFYRLQRVPGEKPHGAAHAVVTRQGSPTT